MLSAALLAWAASPIVAAGIDPLNTAAAELHPFLFGAFGIYQGALLLYAWAAMIVFAVLYKSLRRETLTAMFAIVAGAPTSGCWRSICSSLRATAVAVVNPLEKMLGFASRVADGCVSDIGYDVYVFKTYF